MHRGCPKSAQNGGQVMQRYAIFEGNMPTLEKKIKRIQNKCGRLGCSFHYAEVGEEFRTFQTTNEVGEAVDEVRRFVVVEADGLARLNGWRFVASLEHTSEGNLVHGADGVPDIPSRYYHASPYCEHCKTSRDRKCSYIVQNEETGEFKQVGASCLRDFTFGMSAEAVTAWLSLFDALRKAEEAPDFVGRGTGERYYLVGEMLTYFIEAVSRFGYARTTEPNSTSYVGFTLWGRDHGKLRDLDRKANKEILEEAERRGFKADTEENRKKAQECIAWGKALEGESNYAQNIRTICSVEYTKEHNLGLLASVLPSMNKDLERQAERRERERKTQEEAKTSDHVGSVGDRITVKVAEHAVLASWDTDWGCTSLHKFVDEQGNVYTWKTGSIVPDDVQSIKGTVKSHNDFRGVKQTELTRCKIA